MLAETLKAVAPLAHGKGLELAYEVRPDVPDDLVGDTGRLAQILVNLVGNAIKFTERGEVAVNAHRNGDGTVAISVSDTGCGIPAEHSERIFDEFFQLKNPERDRDKGSGLGLAICRRLAEAMGGTINVDSEPGKGSTFTVLLPAQAVIPH
jgi:signal transduction histidine kinase